MFGLNEKTISMKCNTIRNPVLTIQSDWSELIRRPVANIWLTSKTINQRSEHKTIQFKDQNPIDCPDFDVIHSTNNYLKLLNRESKLLYSFIAPIHSFSSIHSKKSISCIDVTDGEIGVSVGADNALRVWATTNGLVRRELKGHVFEPYFCRFFPSGEVILSGGADMQIKIWSVVTGKCEVSLIGHKSAVLDSAFVERGRNVVTVSRDGSAKLWDCGSKSCVENLIQLEFGNAINTCTLQSFAQDIDLGVRQTPVHEKAFGTQNKLLVIGSELGNVVGIGLNSNKRIFDIKHTFAVNSCRFVNEYGFIFGLQNGEIQLIDIRNTDKVVKCWETSASPVLSLLPLKHDNKYGFFVSRADGSALYHYIDIDSETFQLSGPDFDPIYCMASNESHVFTACRDGNIRKYNIKVVSN